MSPLRVALPDLSGPPLLYDLTVLAVGVAGVLVLAHHALTASARREARQKLTRPVRVSVPRGLLAQIPGVQRHG